MYKISVVTISRNSREKLFRLLKSINANKYKNLEVIVVDNGSSDGTLIEGRKKFPWIKWIDAGKKNIGWGGAYNLGFAVSDRKNNVLLVDSDVVLHRNTIEKLSERLNSNRRIGIVTPMILYLSDKKWVNQAGAEVNLFTGKVSIGWGPKKNFMAAKLVQNSGTVMLIKREVINKIGGFDNWFIAYLDPDFCLRAKKAGFDTWYEPTAIAYHDQSRNQDVWGPRVLSRAYFLGRNRTLFMRRHGKNILIYTLFLPFLLGYYLVQSVKYGILTKWFELVRGSINGFTYKLVRGNKIALPK